MRVFKVEIPEDVKAILTASKLSGQDLFLPPAPLSREMYLKVNKIIELLGGKWNRSAKCHRFPADVSEKLRQALSSGSVIDNKKTYQFFETPEEIAKRMIALSCALCDSEILEPSAGHGAIAKFLPQERATLIEVDQEKCQRLREMGFNPINQDFLAYSEKKFDIVIMNPPFTGGQDAEHILHAYSLLKSKGRIVSICPSMITEKTSKKYRAVQELITEEIELPDCSFEDSGTKVNTKIIIIDKH